MSNNQIKRVSQSEIQSANDRLPEGHTQVLENSAAPSVIGMVKAIADQCGVQLDVESGTMCVALFEAGMITGILIQQERDRNAKTQATDG